MADTDIQLSVKLKPADVKKSAKELQGQIEQVFDKTSGTTDKSLQKIQVQMDKASVKAKNLVNKLHELENQRIPTDEYKEIQKEQDKVINKLAILQKRESQMIESGKNSNRSESWKKLQTELEKTREDYRALDAEAINLTKNGQAFTSGANTKEYQDTAMQLSNVNNQMRILIESARELEPELRQIGSEGTESAQQTYQGWIPLKDFFREWGRIMKVGAVESVKLLGRAASSSYTGVKKLTSNLLKLGASKIKSGLKSITSHFRKLGSSAKSVTSSMGRFLKSIILAGVGIMSLRALFGKLRSAISEGLSNLREYYSENGNVSNSLMELQANLSFLKNSWGAAFAPLISLVLPWINQLVSALATLANYIGAVFSLLGNKSTMTVAKKGMDAYGKSAGGAAQKEKELNAELYSFDELNKQSKQNDNSGSGGGGGGASSMFEEVPVDSLIPEKLKDWVNTLRDLWNAKDFYGVGKHIASLMNDGLHYLDDWINNVFRPWGVEWSGNIAEILNGLVDGFKWETAGKTMADAINSIADIINTFLTTFDFKDLGVGVGEMINGWFDNVDFKLLGETLINIFNSALQFFAGLIPTIDWYDVAFSISEFLQSALENLDYQSIGEILNGVLEAIIAFSMGSYDAWDFTSLAETLGKGLILIISSIDWVPILSAFFGSLPIETALIWPTELLIELLLGLASEVFNAIADEWEEAGYDTIAGFFRGISDNIRESNEWIKGLFEDIINWVRDIFGIHSPSTVFADIGTDLVAGFLQGISENWNKITSFLSEGVQKIKTDVTEGWSKLKQTSTEKWGEIKDKVTEKWNDLVQSFKDKLDDWKSIGTNIVEGIKNGIVDNWTNLKTKVMEKVKDLPEGVRKFLGIASPSKLFAEIGKFIDLGLVNGIEDEGPAVLTSMNELIGNLTDQDVEFSGNFNEDSLFNGFDVTLSRLEILYDKFESLSNVISTIPVPEIANGTIVPPRAIGYNSNTDTVADMSKEEFMEGVRSIVNEMMDDKDTPRQEIHVHAEIDGREIYKVVVNENNSEIGRKGTSPLVK